MTKKTKTDFKTLQPPLQYPIKETLFCSESFPLLTCALHLSLSSSFIFVTLSLTLPKVFLFLSSLQFFFPRNISQP